MRAFGEKIEDGCEYVRGERRGRFQGGADIPAMDGEFKDASMRQGVHGDNAESMIAGFVPILRGEGGDKLREWSQAWLNPDTRSLLGRPLRAMGPCPLAIHRCRRSSCESVFQMCGAGRPSGGE